MIRKPFILMGTFGIGKFKILTSNEIKGLIISSLSTIGKITLKPEDKFGTLVSEKDLNRPMDEVEDEPEGEYFGKLDTLKKMKACLDANEYNNAKELLKNMQKREKAPTYAYRLLMSFNAKQGNILEAYWLYNDYKKRGYYVRGAMYTSLFTACGNCPRSDIALPIAYKLAKYLFESKNTKPNMTNYHAMLKAFGRHGDLSAAFQLVDRLNSRKSNVTTETYNMLIEACITDKASGLRFALLVWHHMLKRNIQPDVFTFKNMAKCAQTCSLGDIELVLDLVRMIVGKEKIIEIQEHHQDKVASLKSPAESHMLLMAGNGQESEMREIENTSVYVEKYGSLEKVQSITSAKLENKSSKSLLVMNETGPNGMSPVIASDQIEQTELSKDVEWCHNSKVVGYDEIELPNLLDPKPTFGSAIDFDDLSTPENRFMLYGGLKGFFNIINHFKVQPDIKLFNILLYCIPLTEGAEEELMELKKKYKLKADVQFMNVLLKRRLRRDKDISFQDCVDTMKKLRISPDLATIIVFASVCKSREEGKRLIELTRSYKIRFSDKFLYPLLKNARVIGDLDYISDIMTAAKEEGVEPGPKSLAVIESALDYRNQRI